MVASAEQDSFSSMQRVEEEFSQQREALDAESSRLTQRLLAWRARRDSIDEALERLRVQLSEKQRRQ